MKVSFAEAHCRIHMTRLKTIVIMYSRMRRLPLHRRVRGDALPSTHTAPRNGHALTEQRIILKDGRTLGFAEYGDPNGKPVLEFHGWPSCRLEASNYDQAGKKVGARVIGIDRPGIGISTFKKDFCVVDWSSDVVELANALSLDRFAVVGVSSGSPYGLACARFIPERLTSCAIVGGISPLKVEGETLRPKQYLDPTELRIMRLANSVPLIGRAGFWYFTRMIRKNPDMVLKQMLKGTPPGDLQLLNDEGAKHNAQQIVAECGRGGAKGPIASLALQMQDWGFRLQDISMHITIWHGERDNMLFHTAAAYFASKLPNTTLHTIPDAGHFTVVHHYAEAVLRDLMAAS